VLVVFIGIGGDRKLPVIAPPLTGLTRLLAEPVSKSRERVRLCSRSLEMSMESV